MALTHTRKVTTHVAHDNLIGSREVQRIEGLCACGETVLVEYDDTVCTCGRHYNLSGQELRPNWLSEAIADGEYYEEE